MPIATPDRDKGGLKKKARRRSSAPSTTDRTSPNPSPAPRPKAGPPSPQRTGRASRPQPVARKRAAPPRTERVADSKRTPAQKQRDRAASDREVRGARQRVVAKRGRGAIPRAAARTVKRGVVASGQAVVRGQVVQARRAEQRGDLFPFRVARGVGTAFAEDPVSTTKGTVRGGRDALVGAIPGLVSLATDPFGVAAAAGEDYARRYGPLLREDGGSAGVREFADRVKKEGAFAEGADAAILVGGAAAPASRVVGLAAKAGKLGVKAERVMKEPRPKLRDSAGGEAKEQAIDPHFFKARRQKKRDRKAAAGQERVIDRADSKARGRPAEDGKQRQKGAVRAEVRQAHARGEVVPSKRTVFLEGKRPRSGRKPSERKLDRAERRSYATEKGRALHSQRAEQRDEGLTGGARGAGRNYAGLDRNERRAYKTALQSGARSVEAGRAWVAARIAKIEAHRKAHMISVHGTDELPVLRKILSDPEAHFTENLLRVAGEERARGERVASGDPGLGDTPEERAQTAELRRRAPQADVLGSPRRGTPVDRAVREADGRVKTRKGAQAKARTKLDRKKQRLAREEGRASLIVAHGRSLSDKAIVRAERAVAIHERAAANHERRASRARSENSRKAHEHKAADARDRAAAAQKRLDEARGGREAIRAEYRPRVRAARGAVTDAQRALKDARGATRAAGEAARDVRGARRRGAKLIDAEPVPAYLKRIGEEADDAGLGDPAFFSSQPRETTRFGVFTVGGPRAAKRDRSYGGKLFAAGTEDGGFQTYVQALARNVKRKFNWNLVADTVHEHALKTDGGKTIQGTPEELERIIEREGFDRGELGFWNEVVFKEARQRESLSDGGETAGTPDDLGESALHAAATQAQDVTAFVDSRDFVLMPKAVLDEIMADTRPSGALGRSIDVVKGKQARILLGTSPAWLQFQVASNMLLTTMAGVGPLEIVRAQRWWAGLSDAEKRAVEPYVGIGHFQDSVHQTKIGAAADNGLINSWRAMKAHPFWHNPRKPLRGAAVSQLNPLDALFRVDNAQNNFFRKAVLYNRVKRDAYARMGQNVNIAQRAQDRILGHLQAPPEEMMRGIIGDRKAMEIHARAVNDFLGDYMTYTARERRWLGRSVMFYGYLRFSLRFAFYTMPTRHPLMTAMMAQLGRMQTEEVRKLLGGDELPWALGRFYFTKGGKLKSIDVSRANPLLNTVTTARFDKGARGVVGSALRVLPPVYVTLANIAYGKSSFEDKDYATGGRTRQKTAQEGITTGQAGRIFLGEMLRLSAIYREAEKAAEGGAPHGADSLLGDRPTIYKRPDVVAGIEQSKEDFAAQGGAGGSLKRGFLPLIPRDDFSPVIAAKIRESKGVKGPAVKPDAETQRLLDAYGGDAAPKMDAGEIDRLLKAYRP